MADDMIPRCLTCEEELTKYTYTVFHEKEQPPERVPKNGFKILEVLSTQPYLFGEPSFASTVWCGAWGAYGHGHFCGLRCGYAWAIEQLRGGDQS